MTSTDDLRRTQYEFSRYLRNPEQAAAPAGIEARRLNLYRQVFYNNIESFISTGFPVLRSLTSTEKWHRMVQDFFANYRCQSPYFLEISQQFLDFLLTAREAEADDLPFLHELAHYEWVELAVETDTDDIPSTGFDPAGDLVQGRPLLSPLASVLHYDYPVHRINPDYQPLQAPATPTVLIVYRDQTDRVRFIEINLVTARLLRVLEENPDFTGLQAIQALASELPALDLDAVLRGGGQALQHLHSCGVILGTEWNPLAGTTGCK